MLCRLAGSAVGGNQKGRRLDEPIDFLGGAASGLGAVGSVSKTGKMMLFAEREAERPYRRRRPHGHNPAKLPLKIVVGFKPS